MNHRRSEDQEHDGTKNAPRRALVLSGGGSRGAWMTGAMKALAEDGRSWDSVHGVSVGALNAGWIAMHPKHQHPACVSTLYSIWNKVLKTEQIYAAWAPFGLKYLYSLWKGSLHSGSPLRRLVEESWDGELIQKSGIKLTVGCVSLSSGRYHAIDQTNPRILDYVLASSHLPLVFEPILIDGELWVDGGIRHQIPIIEALKEEPDEIDIIATSPVLTERTEPKTDIQLKSMSNVAGRAAEILADQVYANDYFTVLRAMKSIEKHGFANKQIKIRLYAPISQASISSMDFSEHIIQDGLRTGYEEIKQVLAEEKALINTDGEHLTQSRTKA